MNLEDTALLRAWIRQLNPKSLGINFQDGDTPNKRVKRLCHDLTIKARYHRKPKWEAIWSVEAPFPIPKWQQQALESLEALNKLPSPFPSNADEPAQWFTEAVCRTLPSEIQTLGDLRHLVNEHHYGQPVINGRLVSHVESLVSFFKANGDSLGALVAYPPKPIKSDKRLVLFDDLPDVRRIGSKHLSNENELAIDAKNDREAASSWINTKQRSKNTFDSYYKETKRFLLWLVENDLILAELMVEDIHGYYAHLANPPEHWIRPRQSKKGEILEPTQLLYGPLSNKAIDYARTVLSQLCTYLQQAGYIRRNPFLLTARPPVVQETTITKYLDVESWQWLLGWIETLPRETKYEIELATRTRWIFALLYHTGIRRSEAAAGKMGDFVKNDGIWALRVIGKGNKERFVTVNSVLLGELAIYRRAMGLPDYPIPAENFPLVASLHKKRRDTALNPWAITKIVTKTAELAAESSQDPYVREKIASMTTHWMRHTNATHRVLAGATLETTQDELGHSDPRTTRIYAKTTNLKRKEDAEKLAGLKQPLTNVSKR